MECWANDTNGAARKKLVTRTTASPITRMGTSVRMAGGSLADDG
jgi:hypothetical protein